MAIAFVGLPRTLSIPKVAAAWKTHLLDPLQPCVDVYLVLGFGSQPTGGGAAPCLACIGHSDRSLAKQQWQSYSSAVALLRPHAAQHSFAPSREVKHQLILDQIEQTENALEGAASYSWIVFTRPDILMLRPFPMDVFARPGAAYRYWDFSAVLPRTMVNNLTVKEWSKGKNPWYGIGLRGRVCREDFDWALRREALDQAWQNVVPLWSKAPSFFRSVNPRLTRTQYFASDPTSRLQLAHRSISTFCFRFETADGVHGSNNLQDGECDEKKAGNDLFRVLVADMAREANSGLAAAHGRRLIGKPQPMGKAQPVATIRPEIENSIDGHLEKVWYALQDASFNTSANTKHFQTSMSVAVRHVRCSCARWVQLGTGQQSALASPDLLGAYDHHRIECSGSTPDAVATERRREFMWAAAHRLKRPLEAPAAQRLDACGLFAELSIFCDVYRYQLDFLREDEAVIADSALRRFRTEARVAIAEADAAPRTSASVLPACSLALDRVTASNASAYTYQSMCDGSGLADIFRLAIDVDPFARHGDDYDAVEALGKVAKIARAAKAAVVAPPPPVPVQVFSYTYQGVGSTLLFNMAKAAGLSVAHEHQQAKLMNTLSSFAQGSLPNGTALSNGSKRQQCLVVSNVRSPFAQAVSLLFTRPPEDPDRDRDWEEHSARGKVGESDFVMRNATRFSTYSQSLHQHLAECDCSKKGIEIHKGRVHPSRTGRCAGGDKAYEFCNMHFWTGSWRQVTGHNLLEHSSQLTRDKYLLLPPTSAEINPCSTLVLRYEDNERWPAFLCESVMRLVPSARCNSSEVARVIHSTRAKPSETAAFLRAFEWNMHELKLFSESEHMQFYSADERRALFANLTLPQSVPGAGVLLV